MSRLTGFYTPRIAAWSPIPLPKKEHRIARSAREPRLEAVLYPATGSGSGPASRPSPRSGTLISRALPAQTSHEHMVSNHTKFMWLRESLDSAAIQLIPSLPSYTTHSYYFVMCSCPDNKSHVPIWLTPLLQYSCHRSKLG